MGSYSLYEQRRDFMLETGGRFLLLEKSHDTFRGLNDLSKLNNDEQ